VTAVWLIALNFVREQRWFILLMLAYIAGITALLAFVERNDGDSLLVFKQLAGYGLFFAVILAAAVFQSERKTRRILAVLAKAVARRQYVGGIVLGVTMTVLIFYVSVFGALFVLFPDADPAGAGRMFVTMMSASLLAAVITVTYASFLHPLAATMAAGLTLAAPLVLDRYAGDWVHALPMATLMKAALTFRPDLPAPFEGTAVALALGESVVLWLLASWFFSLRDITTPVE